MRNANRVDSEKCNAALLAKVGFYTAETEPRQVCCTIRACDPCFGIVSGLARKGDHVTSPERGERENEPVLDLKRTLISEGNANNNFKCCTLRQGINASMLARTFRSSFRVQHGLAQLIFDTNAQQGTHE